MLTSYSWADQWAVPNVVPLVIAVTALAWLALKLYNQYRVPFLDLPGPPADSLLKGNLPAIDAGLNGEPVHGWLDEYGDTILIRHAFYRPDILTRDPGFISTMLSSDAFSVGDTIQRWFKLLGIDHALAAVHNGEAHTRVKKAMMPAFGVPAIRDMWPDILDTTRLLATKIQDECSVAPNGQAVIPSKEYMGLLTLEVLGKSGFGYDFEAISTGKPNEIAQVVNGRVRGAKLGSGWLGWLDYLDYAGLLPIPISPSQRRLASQRGRLHQVSRRIFEQRKQEVITELPKDVTRDDFSKKDIVSVLLRAQLASDLAPSQRMTEEDIMVQIPQIVIAGNETTLNAMIWGLHYLSIHPDKQQKLRDEVQAAASDNWDTVQGLPYLDATVREIMRLNAPGTTMSRTCLRKTTVALRNPVRGRDGKMIDTVTLNKGTIVKALRYEVNTHSDLFGADAGDFRPERHLEDDMDEAQKLGGTWGNSITFSGGQRSCIGYRLALAEIRALLFVFTAQFQISEPPGQRVDKIGMLTGHSVRATGGDGKAAAVGLIPTVFQAL